MGELNSIIEWLVLARNEKCLPGEEEAFDKAIEILKAHEPVEPKKLMEKSKNGYRWRFYCGKCGDEIDRLDKYCRHCGRAVKWY